MAIYKKNINNTFYIFIASHLLIWTLIPTFTNHNLPLDTIEALAWGSNLDWGFNKHPPMSAFLPEIIYFFKDLKYKFIIFIDDITLDNSHNEFKLFKSIL